MNSALSDAWVYEFNILKKGVAAQIDVEVSDQLGFLQDFAPRGAYLETEETFTVVANFLVNASAEVNSESLVTLNPPSCSIIQ